MDRNHMLPPLELALAPPGAEAIQGQSRQPESQPPLHHYHHHNYQHQQHQQHSLAPLHEEYYKFSPGASGPVGQSHPRSAPHPLPPPPTYAQSFHDFPSSSPSTSAAPTLHLLPKASGTTATTATELPPLQLQSPPDVTESRSLPSFASLTGGSHVLSRPPPQLPPISSLRPPSPPSPERERDRRQKHPSTLATTPPSGRSNRWPSLNPLTAFYSPGNPGSTQPSSVSNKAAEMDVDRLLDGGVPPPIVSPDRVHEARANSVSLDDPEVRIAAQALSDLRTDFSPRNRHGSMSTISTSHESIVSTPTGNSNQPEPLLSLLTTSHPFLGRTIHNATAAYMTSKNSSALFKSSAEYVEGYLTPLANTVGSVSRFTGVEGGVRWYLNSRRPAPLDGGGGSNKRRRVDSIGPEDEFRGRKGEIDPNPHKNRRLSSASTMDTLPAYEEVSPSPAYTETASDAAATDRRIAPPLDWQSRIITSTSGLSIAMSEESLRRLKYCLNFIRRVNGHINGTVNTLKKTLEQYEQAESETGFDPVGATRADGQVMNMDEEAQQRRNSDSRTVLAARLDHLRNEVVNTLRKTIDTVSRYAGGALPDNARALVRRHLTSLPQRLRIASMLDGNSRRPGVEGGEAEVDGNATIKQVRERAHMAIVAANAGLDMVDQVGRILDGTITSAEEWCERLGKRVSGSRDGEPHQEARQPHVCLSEKDASGDVKMV
jgi:hypothetical protein